jgi:hypothetical protein
MILIEVVNLVTGKKFRKTAETLEKINKFKNRNINNKVWGHPERWIKTINASQEEIARAVETREVTDHLTGKTHEEIKLEQEYIITVTNDYVDTALEKAKIKKEIIEEMKNVFETDDQNSATANYLTFLMMREDPEFYVGKIDGLETADDVLSYANAKIGLVKTYSLFRLEKKKLTDNL